MDVLTSTEFRKRYASLTNLTAVTVNGHTIGYWHPGIPPVAAVDVHGAPETRPIGLRASDEHPRVNARNPFREFRPVPKPSQRK